MHCWEFTGITWSPTPLSLRGNLGFLFPLVVLIRSAQGTDRQTAGSTSLDSESSAMGLLSWLRRLAGATTSTERLSPGFSSLYLEALEDRCVPAGGPGLFGSTNPALIPSTLSSSAAWNFQLSQALQPRPGAQVAFVGDSIFYDYNHLTGAFSWNAFIEPLAPQNIALGGNSTGEVLWEIGSGLLGSTSPQVIVVLVGTNNLFFYQQTPQQVAEGIWGVVTLLQATESQADILLLSVLPVNSQQFGPTANQRVDETNRLIAGLDDGSQVYYVDVNSAFRDANGEQRTALFQDAVHPNADGYNTLTAVLLPRIQSALAKKVFGIPDTASPPPPPPTEWIQVAGDWDGDGQDGLAAVDPATGEWYLRNDTSSDVIDKVFSYGGPGWRPVAGDWDGDGDDDIGTFDPATARWYLRNDTSSGAPDHVFTFGLPGWIPIAGDWDGDGRDSIGIVDPQTSHWYLSPGLGSGPLRASFVYGLPGWVPVVGDWDNDGTDDIGVVDPSKAEWFLNSSNEGDGDIERLVQGGAGWDYFAGNWDGSGTRVVAQAPNGTVVSAPTGASSPAPPAPASQPTPPPAPAPSPVPVPAPAPLPPPTRSPFRYIPLG
jgi:hypothetical protein